jgi:hypothetical protein
MNSVIDTARTAELNRDSITQLVTQFYNDACRLPAHHFRSRALQPLGFAPPMHGRLLEHRDAGQSQPGNVFAMAVPGVTALHFERWLQLWALHTTTMFDGAQARHLQKVASDIARNLYRGYFGNAAGFDVIARRCAMAAVEQAAPLVRALELPYRHGFVTDVESDALPPGLDADTVRAISRRKREPEFLLKWRLAASSAGRR